MEVLLLKKPFEVSLSGNPIPFVFQLTPYGPIQRTAKYKLQVNILIEKVYRSRIYENVYAQLFFPDISGQISMDVRTVLDAYLEFYMPKLSLQNLIVCKDQVKRFQISYQLQLDDAFVSDLATTDSFSAIKAGLPYEEWNPISFFHQNILSNHQPLHYAPVGEKYSADKKQFISWLYPNDDFADQFLEFIFFLNDETTATYTPTQTLKALKWATCIAPAGLPQINYTPPVGKYIVSYTVQVKTEAGIITAPFRYTLDYRNFENTYFLLYRNSLGGLDTLRLRGQVDLDNDYEHQKATRISPAAYFANNILVPQAIQKNNFETQKFTGNTGFISQPAMDNLRDLLLSKQIFEIADGKLLPVSLNKGNIKMWSSKDALFNMEIGWQRAYTNEFYAPNNTVAVDATCPAVESFSVTQINKNTLHITWSLQIPYDRIKVEIITDTTATFIYTGNTGSIEQTFENPADTEPVDITVTGQCLCDEESIPVLAGPVTTIELSVSPNSLPVAVDDTFNISNGYTDYITLDGNLLANDYDPDGDPIGCQANSGSTDQGGWFSLISTGIAQYKPPSSLFIGVDKFQYRVAEIADPLAVSNLATVWINVGGTQLIKVYVKLVPWEFYNVYNYPDFKTFGKYYINFYSDINGTQLIDTTDLGININVHRKINNGGTITETDLVIPATGVQVLIHNGLVSESNPTPLLNFLIQFTLMPGTGYTVIQ